MMWKQLALIVVAAVALGCTHENAASGATDTQKPKAEPPACTSDADCQPVDVYCGGCQCLALPVSTAVPKCQGNEVQCFAQPCRGQRAVCTGGACALAGGGDQ